MSSVRIKHCGITSLDDAELCVDAGAWALGMILWPGSARRCSLEEAGRITRAMRRFASASLSGGPCWASSTAAVNVPPQVRKSLAVNSAPK